MDQKGERFKFKSRYVQPLFPYLLSSQRQEGTGKTLIQEQLQHFPKDSLVSKIPHQSTITASWVRMSWTMQSAGHSDYFQVCFSAYEDWICEDLGPCFVTWPWVPETAFEVEVDPVPEAGTGAAAGGGWLRWTWCRSRTVRAGCWRGCDCCWGRSW